MVRPDSSRRETRPRPPSTAALVDRVRKMAMALPGTTEKQSHGEPAFFRERMFIIFDRNHHGSGHIAMVCRAEPGMQQAFVEASPEHFFVPPYLGHQGWVGVRLDRGLDWTVVQRFVEQAWQEAARTAPKRAGPARPPARKGKGRRAP